MNELDYDLLVKQNESVIDQPSEYDFLWSEYAEGNTDLSKFPWKQLKVWNQYDQKDTYKACSCYWLTAIFNGNQIMEFDKKGIEFEQENPRWKRQVFQAERWYPDMWASLQDMMSFFKKRWLIDGYVVCKNLKEVQNALKNWYGIYTWSAKCSWTKTSKSWIFTYDDNGWKHCFSIIDCTEDKLIAINSFGEAFWNKWFFDIPNANYKDLYSCYAIIDHDDTWKIEELRYKMEYQKAIELWLTNWTRPDEPATRRETAVMIYRAYKKILDSNK